MALMYSNIKYVLVRRRKKPTGKQTYEAVCIEEE